MRAAATLLLCASAVIEAASPPNLTSDIPWTDTGGVFDPASSTYNATFNGVVDIEAAFNNGRRQEEAQLGLADGSLGVLVLPDQALWDGLTPARKALYLHNAERIARAGMSAGVIGLGFASDQQDVTALAQDYADLLIQENDTGHTVGGQDVFARIDNDPALGLCHEFLSRGENLAYFWTSASSNPLPVERAIYAWIYDDSGSAWGHREASLLQDADLANGNALYGFANNSGNTADEGYLGLGVAESPDYDPLGLGWVGMGTAVVLDFFDPIDTGTCPWEPHEADLTVVMDDGHAVLLPADTTTYSILVGNAGPGAANGTRVLAVGDADLIFTDLACASASGGGTCPTLAALTLDALQGSGIAIPTLPANSSVQFFLDAEVDAYAIPGDPMLNQASVVAPDGVSDPVQLNNSAVDSAETTAVEILAFATRRVRADGKWTVVVSWESGNESGTFGYELYRLDVRTGDWVAVGPMILATGPGSSYQVNDPGAGLLRNTYRLREITSTGHNDMEYENVRMTRRR
jgi:hypothetical protein